jgi:membrane complex biogenesis BtpA family protein
MATSRRRTSADRLLPRGALVGMVHVGALPGTPRASLSLGAIVEAAVDDARTLAKAGFDAVMIENMHDVPYVHGTQDPAVVAMMTRVGLAVREVLGEIPLGVQILSGGNREALAVALAVGARFIRCENFVFSHVADEGLLDRAEAGPLLRYRRSIGAEHVRIFCDLKKKHASHAITADVSLADAAEAAEFFGADGLIITGVATGRPTSLDDVAEARRASTLPVLVGSGVTPDSAASLLEHADALIVGSWIKAGGVWTGAVDATRAAKMVKAVAGLRRDRG